MPVNQDDKLTELEVPQASADAVSDVHYTLESEACDYTAAARAIATPMVIAELRRLAEDFWCPSGHEIALRNRADELEAGEQQR